MKVHPLFAAGFLLVGVSAPAQPNTSGAASEKSYRWEVTVDVASTAGGPAGDLENAMKVAGYGQPFVFFGTSTYPYSSTGLSTNGANPVASIRYSLNKQFAVALAGGSARLGTTYGHATSFVTVESSATTVGALVFYKPGDAFRIGAGPAYYRLQMHQTDGQEQTLRANRLGFVAEAGVTFPARTRVFCDMHVQYRGAGRADLGSLTPPAAGPSSPSPPIQVNSMDFNHWSFAVGVGVRL